MITPPKATISSKYLGNTEYIIASVEDLANKDDGSTNRLAADKSRFLNLISLIAPNVSSTILNLSESASAVTFPAVKFDCVAVYK